MIGFALCHSLIFWIYLWSLQFLKSKPRWRKPCIGLFPLPITLPSITAYPRYRATILILILIFITVLELHTCSREGLRFYYLFHLLSVGHTFSSIDFKIARNVLSRNIDCSTLYITSFVGKQSEPFDALWLQFLIAVGHRVVVG